MSSFPSLDHVSSKTWNDVYEPSDDSFLFVDALKKEEKQIIDQKPKIIVEIGSGSGYVITYLSSIVGSFNALFFATDINPAAAITTMETAKHNSFASLEVVRTKFLNGISRIHGKIDILLFNPPYVPTSEEEITQHDKNIDKNEIGIEAAWAGGIYGTSVLDRLIPQLKSLLSPTGVFYLVAVEENNPVELSKRLKAIGFKTTVVLKRQAANELLYILKIVHQK